MNYINTFTNETIIYNDHRHTYTTVDGKVLLGASSYAKRFGKEFPKDDIINKLAPRWQMPAADIADLWKINADISNAYGTAIHAAMELWFRYHKKGKEIQSLRDTEHNYALPKNVHIRDIVLDFVESFGHLDGVPEATLSAVDKGMAGRTDLIIITGDKTCRVGDYKTNNELDDDKVLQYQHQLSFYADMLTHHGWTVEGLDIFHHDGNGWTLIDLPVLPVVLDNMPTEVLTDKLPTPARRPPAFSGV
jgi:hypothetical protein